MSSQLVSFGLWYFVPNLVTGWLHTIYYRVAYAAGEPRPQPGHPKFVRDRKIVFTLVIVSYLLYTIYEADWQMQRDGTFYSLLGLPLNADERRIQTNFRRLTVKWHPDKVTQPELRPAAEAMYINIKLARETLLDPVKRFAYDRFGPSMLEWKRCTTRSDYILAGITRSAPLYIGSTIFMVAYGFLGYLQSGQYWRYVTVAAIMVFEMYTVTRPFHPPILTYFINPILRRVTPHHPYLPFQALSLARKVSLSIFIAINQLAPQYKPQAGAAGSKNDAAANEQIDRLTHLGRALDAETKRLLALEMSPFRDDHQMEGRARDQLKAWLVRNEIRNDAGVSAAIKQAIQRRSQGSEEDVVEVTGNSR